MNPPRQLFCLASSSSWSPHDSLPVAVFAKVGSINTMKVRNQAQQPLNGAPFWMERRAQDSIAIVAQRALIVVKPSIAADIHARPEVGKRGFVAAWDDSQVLRDRQSRNFRHVFLSSWRLPALLAFEQRASYWSFLRSVKLSQRPITAFWNDTFANPDKLAY
jgi:hypothetical protein